MSKFEVTKRAPIFHRYQDERHAMQAESDAEDDDDTYNKQLQWTKNNLSNNPTTRASPHTSRYHVSQRLRRIEQLAKPKIRLASYQNNEPYRVRPSALTYNASERLSDLAMPKRAHAKTPSAEGLSIITDPIGRPSPYILSERMQVLAQPKKIYSPSEFKHAERIYKSFEQNSNRPMARIHNSDDECNVKMNRLQRLAELTRIPKHKLTQKQHKKAGAVSYSALVCKPSPRVEELAWPKMRRDPKQNEYAFNIKPAALKYNPTDRINDLAMAKPKQNRSDYY